MTSESRGTTRRSSRVKSPPGAGSAEEKDRYDWPSHSQRSLLDTAGKEKRRSSTSKQSSSAKQRSPKQNQVDKSEEQILQKLLDSSTPANIDLILLVKGLVEKVGRLESELERFKDGKSDNSHPLRNRDSMMLGMRDDSESSNYSLLNGSAIDWSNHGGRTSSLLSKPPSGRSLRKQAPSGMALSPSNSKSGQEEEEENEDEKKEMETPPARESETRWKPLHVAMLGTVSSFDGGGEDEVRNKISRRHSSQFSRKSSIVFMHPEDGTECPIFTIPPQCPHELERS